LFVTRQPPLSGLPSARIVAEGEIGANDPERQGQQQPPPMPRLVEDNNITIEPVFPVFGFLLGYLARFVSQYMSNLAWQNWVNLVKASVPKRPVRPSLA